MRRAIYPGSFDPPHNGHLDVVRRAARLFDEVIVAVAFNERKATLFSPEERTTMLGECTRDLANVRVVRFHGLLVEFARSQGAAAMIRGLRAVSDFEFELQMSLMNRKLDPELETVFLTPIEQSTYLSSRIVKEIALLGGAVDEFVPPCVAVALRGKFQPGATGKGQP
jgi:pantetheine-phosphate adenylyltransferase